MKSLSLIVQVAVVPGLAVLPPLLLKRSLPSGFETPVRS